MAVRIVILGDVHAHEERLEASLDLVSSTEADLVLLVGDIGVDPPSREPARSEQRGPHDESIRQVLERVRKSCGGLQVFVPGNHDLADPPEDLPAVNLDGSRVILGGISLAGLGGSGPDHHGFPYEWTDEQAAARLEPLLARGPVDLLLCHAPPRDSRLDLTAFGAHVGSAAVRTAIERARPSLFVCGHIHEAWSVEWIYGVPCLNAGAMGEPYGQVIAWVVDWEDGPVCVRSFRREPGGSAEIREWREAD